MHLLCLLCSLCVRFLEFRDIGSMNTNSSHLSLYLSRSYQRPGVIESDERHAHFLFSLTCLTLSTYIHLDICLSTKELTDECHLVGSTPICIWTFLCPQKNKYIWRNCIRTMAMMFASYLDQRQTRCCAQWTIHLFSQRKFVRRLQDTN